MSTLRSWGVALACLGLLAAPAAAADPLDWVPPEAELVFVFRGADLLADLVDGVATRFGGVPAVDRMVERVRAYEVAGFRPGARKWGGGLAPGRGLAVFAVDEEDIRLVIGADDPEAARARLVELLKEAEAPVTATADGFSADDRTFRCGGADGFLVCGTAGVPAKAAARPDWLPKQVGNVMLLAARGAILAEMLDGPFAHGGWLAFDRHPDRLELTFDTTLAGEATTVLQFMAASGPGGPAAEIARLVDAAASLVVKIAFDGPKLLGGVESLAGGEEPPPELRALWSALKTHWSGDLGLTFDGGFDHPVFLVGLNTPAGGPALVEAVAATLRTAEVEAQVGPSPTRPKLGALTLKIEGLLVHLHHTVVGSTLVLAAAPADVARRVDGAVRPADLDPAFSERGNHGLVVWAVPSLLSAPWIAEVLAGEGEGAILLDAQVLLGLLAALVDEGGVLVRPRTDGVGARMWWRTL